MKLILQTKFLRRTLLGFLIYIIPTIGYAEKSPIIKARKFSVAAFQYPDFQLIAFKGKTLPVVGEPNPFRVLLNHLHPTKPIVLWVLHSPGGHGDAYVQAMDSLKNNGLRRVKMYPSGYCASGCTFWAAMADKTYYFDHSTRFGLHRAFIFKSNLVLQTKERAAKHYIKLGGNEEWFLNNQYIFDMPDNDAYFLSLGQALSSGLADEQILEEDFVNLVTEPIYLYLEKNM